MEHQFGVRDTKTVNFIFPVMCDCCGKEKLAEIRDGKIVIYDTRHGQRHFVVLNIKDLASSVLTTISEGV